MTASHSNPSPMPPLTCPVCGEAMTPQRPVWWHLCGNCGMQASTLEPLFGDRPMADMFDWEQRNAAFYGLREANAGRLLDRVKVFRSRPSRLLDVGCAEGWFVRIARAKGYDALGLEADHRMAERADPALGILSGFFPEALRAEDRFDIITFNDVFEHLPDVDAAMAACTRHLTRDGVLVINLPNASGGIYRIARVAARFGFCRPFERMWQAGYPSPHLSYFTPATLARLAGRHGFVELARFSLPAVEARGLWARIRYDRTRSLAYSIAAWCAMMGAMPLLAALPSDTGVQIFARPDR